MSDRELASVFIQWKGTDVCLDFHCFKCNTFAHLDADFAYYLKCPTCGQHYAMPSTVSLMAIDPPDSSCVRVPDGSEQNLDDCGWPAQPVRTVRYVGEEA